MSHNTQAPTSRTIELGQARPVAELGMSGRVQNTLLRHGINTVGQLIARSSSDLQQLQGLAKIGLKEVEDTLARHGLSLAPHTSTNQYVRHSLSRSVRNHYAWQQPVTEEA